MSENTISKPTKKMKANKFYIHLCVFLSLFALWGYVEVANKYLLLLTVLSFFGALCFSFIRMAKLIRGK